MLAPTELARHVNRLARDLLVCAFGRNSHGCGQIAIPDKLSEHKKLTMTLVLFQQRHWRGHSARADHGNVYPD